jgi:hypothetical protein
MFTCQRVAVLDQLTNNHRLFYPYSRSIRSYSIVDILKELANIAPNQRDAIIQQALQFITPRMFIDDRANILRAVVNIAPDQRVEIIQGALQLITPGMFPYRRIAIINELTNIAADQGAEIIELILQLINYQVSDSKRVEIVKSLAGIAINERVEIIEAALQVITPEMDGYDRAIIIRDLVNIAADQRSEIVELALQLITPQMNHYYERVDIINQLANIAADQRSEIVELALQLITPQMRGYERTMIIENLANVNRDQRANYVQDWIERGQARLFRNPRVLARNGLNVHANNRDERVRAAMKLLRQHQGEIPRNRINQSVGEFIQYLNDREMDLQDKQLAKRALLAPKDEREVFGALISEDVFTLLGLETSGKEVIGRLWIFASEIAEPDKTNAKVGMISALKN